jgi:DNA-binding MarR family transcriptional regulator
MRTREVLESRIGYQLKRAEHVLRLEMDGALREVGLTTPQYAALSVLGDEPGLSGAELARRCFVTPQTMNAIVVNLEAVGLVLRTSHPEHGRVLQAYLTAAGEELVSRAHEIVEAIEKRMLAALDPEERLQLLNALRSCTDSLQAKVDEIVAEGPEE